MPLIKEYEVKIRMEKHGVYFDFAPFYVKAKSKSEAIMKAFKHSIKRQNQMFKNKNKNKVSSWQGIMADSTGSEVSVITTRIQ